MPRASAKKIYFQFVKGKNSDSSPLAPAENTARILENVDLATSGKLSRRLGLDFEGSYELSTETFPLATLQSSQINYYEWLNVEETGGRNFAVIRIGHMLYLYDQASEPMSGARFAEVDISAYAVDVIEAKLNDIQVASGKGVLFITGEFYDPFYVEYNSFTDTFSMQGIEILTRDFEGVDDGLAIEERPTSLSENHHYNLLNQGWREDRITTVGFPSNADIEYLGVKVNDDGDKVFDLTELSSNTFGNTRAPQGHYILNEFDKNRIEVSGITVGGSGATLKRPRSVAFFAGRAWYGGVKGKVYFSQIIEDLSFASKCYQEQDPTAETFNELLATDGGVIKIPEASEIYKLMVVRSELLVMASNGIWTISGGTENFTANTTSVSKISEVGVLNPKAALRVEDTVFLWSEEGIFSLQPDKISGLLTTVSMSENRIKIDFNQISPLARSLAQATYDRVQKIVYWSYHDSLTDTATTNINGKFNAMLIYNVTLDAFYDYKISDLASHLNSPFFAGALKRSSRNEGTSTESVRVNGELVTEGGVGVATTLVSDTYSDTPIKLLTMTTDGTDGKYQITFGEFCSRSFHDWFSADSAGENYESIIETNPETLGEGALDKQATWLFTYYDFKRDGFGTILQTPRPDPSYGYRVSQAVVEIIRKGAPSMRASQQALEVLRKGQPSVRSTQTVIEVLRSV